MQEKSGWKEERSVFGLPKIKRIRLKVKKEKAEEAKTAATAATGTATPAETKPQEDTQQAAAKKKK